MTLSPRPRAPESPFALGETPRTWRQLHEDAALVLAGRVLPGNGREVMVACGDRYLQAVVMLACWRAGNVAALPPNGRQETIDALCAARGISLVVHDGGGVGGLDVRTLLGAQPQGGEGGPAPPFELGLTFEDLPGRDAFKTSPPPKSEER